MDIDRIISIIRTLREEGAMVAGAPTNALAQGQIAGTVEAGDNPPVKKKKNYIYGTGFRKNWMTKRNKP